VRRSLLLFLVLCLCSLLGSAFAPGRELRAQHVVDAKGGGTHIDLQAAIDQARPGDRIRVRGGVWQRIVIRKSLTLIGDPMPTLTAPFNGVGTGLRQPPALELDGNGSEVLRLVDVRIEGLALGSGSWSSQSAAIEVDDWGRLELVRCHIRAMEWWSVTGLANGAPGIRVEGDLFLNATDSWIQASSSIGHAWVPPSNVDGAAGIDAPEADVLLVGSTVLGGAGPDFVLFGCPTQPCPCPQFRHRGGDAVRAERLWSYGASLQPGPGGQLSCWNGVSFQKGGRQVEGRRFVGRQQDDAARQLWTLLPPRVGGAWQLAHASLPIGGYLVIGSAAERPMRFGPGRLWLELVAAPLIFVPIAPGRTQLSLLLPNAPGLAGLPLLGQTLDAATLQVGSPSFELIRY
jgi:hypothetical protein